jgi:hypothetical protein
MPMNLNCTFAEVMKKILFFLCIVLLVSFMPSRSYALSTFPSHDFGIVRQKLYISNNTHGETPCFDAVLLEEDQDDVSTSEKEKFSPEKSAFSITSFVTTNFNDNLNRRFTDYFFNCSQPGFIYFRALRL